MEGLCLEGRSGGTGLRGGSTGRSSKQEVKEEEEEGEGGGRYICLWGPKGARGIGRGEEGSERPVAMGTCSLTITYINRNREICVGLRQKKTIWNLVFHFFSTSLCSSWKRSADCDSLLAAPGVAEASSVTPLLIERTSWSSDWSSSSVATSS